ncbi:zinc finger protein 777-like [Uranotaenia lowii]|uniref:zinc finger protein 777-like n=1 Tax=Uranotaenia lowii TaxID=190385 RepID=UPI00247A2708|nr:zinc finger protein 777-like [Uranotaenia lowii]
MPRTCSVLGCQTHKKYFERGVRSFDFPRKDPELMAAWIRACGREQNFVPAKTASVCERHFTEEEKNPNPRIREAVPSLNLYWKLPKEPTMDVSQTGSVITSRRKRSAIEKKTKPVKTFDRIVESVLVQEANSTMQFETEVLFYNLNQFCRTCGIKCEEGQHFEMGNLGSDDNVETLKTLCITQDPLLDPISFICEKCYQEFTSFLQFVVICKNGQQSLISRLQANQLSVKEECLPTVGDASALESDIEPDQSDNDLPLSRSNSPIDDIVDAEKMDQYVDKLMEEIKMSKKHMFNRPHDCIDCGEIMKGKMQFKRHRLTCPLIGSENSLRHTPYTCSLCNKTVRSIVGYRCHLWKMHKNLVLRPKQIDKPLPEELIKMGERRQIVCPLCQKRFVLYCQLMYHLPSHKSTNQHKGINQYTILDSRDGLEERKQEPEPKPLCSICGKKISPAALPLHMKFHLKQKDFKCKECGKLFYSNNQLQIHVDQKHKKIRYSCDVCGASLATKATLYRHKLLHNEAALIYCEICPERSKRFTNRDALRRHMNKQHNCVNGAEGVTQLAEMLAPETAL